jgi:hypothetical protein
LRTRPSVSASRQYPFDQGFEVVEGGA